MSHRTSFPDAAPDGHDRRLDFAFAGLLSALFLGLLLVYGPVNIEQYHSSHPGVRVFHRGLLTGRYLFWTDALGLGTPLPLGENLAFHPLFLFGQFLPLRWVLSVFWVSHLTVGGYYVQRLCRLVGVDSTVARVVAFGFIASPATANYAYTDDWPALFVGWTMLPVIVFQICRLAAAANAKQSWRAGSLLVLSLAFALWNSHLAYLFVLGSIFVCLVLLLSAGDWRSLFRFTAVAGAAALVASERIAFVAREALRFPPGVEKVTQGPVSLGAWLEQLYRPLSAPILAALTAGDPRAAWRAYESTMAYVRIPFLGLVFSIAAVGAVVFTLRAGGASPGDRRRRAVALCFCASVIMSLLPPVVVYYAASGMWLYRDPAVLFGLVAAGIALTGWWQRTIAGKRLVPAALVLQAIQITLAVSAAVLVVYVKRQENVQFYSGRRHAEFAHWVETATGGTRARAYLSPRVNSFLFSEKPRLADLGLLAEGDLEPLGLLPVNSRFKNVAMDAVYPSYKRQHGVIRGEAEVIRDRTTFDVLAIDYLLVRDSEQKLDLSGFETAAPAFHLEDGTSLLLLRNPDAWPRANLFRPHVEELTLVARAGCQPGGILCKELGPLARAKLPADVQLSGDNGRLVMSADPAAEPRVIVVSQLYRPAWRARAGDGSRLRTFSVADALLGIEVPPGVSKIRVVYTPRWRVALLLLGATGVLTCVAILTLTRPRRAGAD